MDAPAMVGPVVGDEVFADKKFRKVTAVRPHGHHLWLVNVKGPVSPIIVTRIGTQLHQVESP